MKEFNEWIPGQSKSVTERAIFQTHKFNPVDYWCEMSKIKGWEELSKIALRIISIPPTEAACERVFSARREIMTKHISNINDITIEARAHLKAGLYQQINEKNKE